MGGMRYTSYIHVGTLTFRHLFYHGTKACMLAQKKPVSRVCSKEVTACFTSVSVALCLPESAYSVVQRDVNRWTSD